MSRHGHKLNFDDSNLSAQNRILIYKIEEKVRCLDLDEESKLPNDLSIGSESYESFKK